MGIEDRLARLEDRRTRSANAAPVPSEEERRQRWLWRQRHARRQKTPKSVFVARSRLAWLREVGRLPGFASADQLIEDIMEGADGSGYRQPPETRTRSVIEREVCAAIRRQDEGLGHLSVPAEWDAALGASEKLRERYLAMPPEHVASWWLEAGELQERGEPEAALEAHERSYEEPYGITEEVLRTALGPNAAVLTDEERGWMLRAAMDDDREAEAAVWEQRWQIREAVRQMEAQQAN